MAESLDISAFWDEFKQEAQELAQKASECLLRLEQKADDAEAVQELARVMHTLKGSSRLMRLDKLNRLMHQLEEMLGAIKRGQCPFSSAGADLIFKSLDLIPLAIENARQTGDEAIQIEGLCQEVVRVLGGETGPASREPVPAAPAAATGPLLSVSPAEPDTSAEPTPPVAQASTQPALPAESPPGQASLAPGEKGGERESLPPHPQPLSSPGRGASATDSEEQPAPAAPTSVPRRGHAVETIRVDTRKLDSLANVAGEMVVNLLKFEAIAASVRGLLGTMKQHVRIWQQLRDEISTALGTSLAGARTGETTLLDDTVERCDETGKVVLGELERLRQRLNEDITRVATSTRKLEEDVLSIRMHPVSTLFNTFPRAVRDIARELGKSVNLVVQGSETELDRKILEAIRDPLLHLVRNAVYHGIEPPAERASQGKPPEGIVRLSAWQQGDQVFIQVTDDGRGIDAVGVRRVAVAKGLIALSTADALSREDSLRLIFEPGLSTSPTVNDISGRGVGMDVVKASVEEMHGEVRVESQVGSGTAVTVVLPLTLAISRALLVRSSAQTYAVPTTSVETTTRARRGDVKSVEGKEVILVRGTAVPIVPLARVLGADSQPRSSTSETVRIVVISHSQHRFGFVVDELIGEQEIVVKPLGAPLRRVKNVAGAAILGSGEVVTVLHVPDIVAAARASVLKQAMGSRRRELVTRKRKRILVVEDSLTARELERHMLEAGGYEVETAVDGVEAMAKLAQQRVDLIVTDVQMPRMNGFEFTTRVRADERLRTIPVIIVTTRGDEADRQRGMEVGADAYLIKASLTPAELLDCARRLAG